MALGEAAAGGALTTAMFALMMATVDGAHGATQYAVLSTLEVAGKSADFSLAVKSVHDLLEVAKTKPGALNYSSNGVNSVAYFAGELLKTMTGTQMTHVAYQGAAPASTAIAGGQVQFRVIPAVR